MPQQLSDGSVVQLTVRRLVAPSGAAIDKQGVQPDVEAALTVDDLQKGNDPQFAQAVELLQDVLTAPEATSASPSTLPVPSPSPVVRR
jgi:C-terminal processing protease CtpA/Prc